MSVETAHSEPTLAPRRARSRSVDAVIALVLVGLVVGGVLWGRSGKNRDLHANQAEEHFNGKEYGRAIEEYTEAIRHDPKCALAYANRASAYFNNGDFERAIDDCNRALEIDPQLAIAYANR